MSVADMLDPDQYSFILETLTDIQNQMTGIQEEMSDYFNKLLSSI